MRILYDILVIGGGASGLTSAISAAKSGAQVLILEHKDRIGKKILATGNGRCNYTNLYMNRDCYRGQDLALCEQVINHMPPQAILDFFSDLGIYPKIKDGYAYPNSMQAASVLDVLRYELEALKVTVMTEVKVDQVQKETYFQVHTNQGTFHSKKLILATGGKASKDLGSDGSGYVLAKAFGHHLVDTVPGLTGLYCREHFYKTISGVRTEARVTLCIEDKAVAADKGEVQLTSYGLSGIPVFQVSRFASYGIKAGQKVTVVLDFLPEFTQEALGGHIRERIKRHGNMTLEMLLNGLLNKKLNQMLIKESGLLLHMMGHKLKPKEIDTLVRTIKHLTVVVDHPNQFASAQVTAGGIDTTEFDEHCQSKFVPGLYMVGELLDVDGICGGYNLHFAWATGILAGTHAGRKQNA